MSCVELAEHDDRWLVTALEWDLMRSTSKFSMRMATLRSTSRIPTRLNVVEGRDDISFRLREIIDLITELANPLLFAPLDVGTVRNLIQRSIALEEAGRPDGET